LESGRPPKAIRIPASIVWLVLAMLAIDVLIVGDGRSRACQDSAPKPG
jgi:hypothetical protein